MYEGRAELRTAALTVIPRGGTHVLVVVVRARPILDSPDPFGLDWNHSGGFTMDLTAFVPVADPTLPVGLRNDSHVPPTDVQLPASTLTTVDFHLVRPLAFEILARQGSRCRLRLSARCDRDISLACNAEFAVRSDIDYSKADWNDFVRDEYAVSEGRAPQMTEAEWLYTDRLRRMCQHAFPAPSPSVEPPRLPGWRAMLQRIRGDRPERPKPPKRLVQVSQRQCQFLQAALIAATNSQQPAWHSEHCRDVAAVIVRVLEGESTAADEERLRWARDFSFVSSADVLLRSLQEPEPELFFRLAHYVDQNPIPNFAVQDCFPDHSREACDALRDILGNPFRPVNFEPRWRTAATTALAREMARSRDHSAMPVLADALEDAGCSNETVLRHARGDRPHFPGCWLVEAVLGR